MFIQKAEDAVRVINGMLSLDNLAAGIRNKLRSLIEWAVADELHYHRQLCGAEGKRMAFVADDGSLTAPAFTQYFDGVTSSLSSAGALSAASVSASGGIKAGGVEYLKFYSYTYTLTADDAIDQVCAINITGVTSGKVRGLLAVGYNAGYSALYSHDDRSGTGWVQCRIDDATPTVALVEFDSTYAAGDTMSILIVEAI